MQLMAHFVADFILQSEAWCKRKEEFVFGKQQFFHFLIVSTVAYIFSFDLYFAVSAVIIGLSHYAIDTLKSYYVKKHDDKKAVVFFLDQLLHIIILCLVSWIYLKCYDPKPVFNFQLSLHNTAIIAAFLFCSKPANVFIKKIFELFNLTIPKVDPTKKDEDIKIAVDKEKELENAGKVIGVMERFMTLALVLSTQYAAVGLIIAAKSILRFNNQQKNEYILVGTLLSFGFAILIGVLLNHF
jgi:phosphate/sulfate permease